MADITETIRHWSHHRRLLAKRGKRLEQVLKEVIGVYSTRPNGHGF